MNALDGQRVAFTGKLASMTRPEAAELVRAHGGTFVPRVTRRTSLLIVGQEGWPLKKDGSLSDKLQTARQLEAAGQAIRVLSEEELLQRLGMEGESGGVHKRFTLAQLGRLLQVPRDRLRAWMRAGLVQPVATVQGMCYFDFHQVTGVRMLWELAQAGVTSEKMRRSLEQLSTWLPRLETSLTQLNLLEQNGELLVRLDHGQLADPSGQLHFDFETTDNSPVADGSPASVNWERAWDAGCALEESGQLREAARAYRDALFHGGPDAQICFNLGNVLHALGQLGQAAERYRQAVELEHDFFEAWNNLGNTLAELNDPDDARDAYRQALHAHPAYADAHYNLADLLEQQGQFSEARRLWKEYLRLEPIGQWADYARACLNRFQKNGT